MYVKTSINELTQNKMFSGKFNKGSLLVEIYRFITWLYITHDINIHN